MNLELAKIPTVTVVSNGFIAMARQVAYQLGLAALPFAEIPHPVGASDLDVVRERAEVAVQALRDGLTLAATELSDRASVVELPGPVCLERTKTHGGIS